MGDGGKLMQMLGRMTSHAAALQAFRSRGEIAPRLRRFLDVPEDVDGAMAAACADSSFPVEIVRRIAAANAAWATKTRSEEHTSELQSLMRLSYAVFCLKKKNKKTT